MIRVINICSDTNIGGAGRCILTFLKYCDREKFEVSVILPPNSRLSPAVKDLGVRVIEVDGIADKSLDFAGIKALEKVFKEHKCDVVHTHGSMSGRIAAKRCGCQVVYTRHSVFPVSKKLSRNPGKWINGKINEHYADAIIAVAQAAKDNLTESGISPERVEVILNGVEAQKHISYERTNELKSSYGIAEDDFVVGILARLEDVKGHEYLLNAAKLLKENNKKIKVIIAGTGGIEDKLKKKCQEMKLDDIIIFAGFIDNVSEVLGIIDVQINASYGTEATSLSLLEGMSLGVPSIVSDYGGNPGVIEDGVNGLIFKSRDCIALAECMSAVISDREYLKKLSEGSIKVFEKKFTAERYARDIENVYQRLHLNNSH